MLMPTSPATGTRTLRHPILPQRSLGMATSCGIVASPSCGHPNSKPSLHSPPPKLSTLECLVPSKTHFPVVWLLEEMKQMGHTIHATKARVHCRVFQDNSGALEIANNPKYRPRTKHINQRFRFFRSHIGKHLTILPIATEDQIADTFTKPLAEAPFLKTSPLCTGVVRPRGSARFWTLWDHFLAYGETPYLSRSK